MPDRCGPACKTRDGSRARALNESPVLLGGASASASGGAFAGARRPHGSKLDPWTTGFVEFFANAKLAGLAATITYVRTWEGWLYLAVVIDLFSRRIVGWAIPTPAYGLVADVRSFAACSRIAAESPSTLVGVSSPVNRGQTDSSPPTVAATGADRWSEDDRPADSSCRHDPADPGGLAGEGPASQSGVDLRARRTRARRAETRPWCRALSHGRSRLARAGRLSLRGAHLGPSTLAQGSPRGSWLRPGPWRSDRGWDFGGVHGSGTEAGEDQAPSSRD